ncbi:MAG: hypothetical protein HZB09_00605 [Candidatus Yonathbacteria bacterium]|nr:hypothetical protein [Candidatus Yonathbacteria bacterium]
MFQFSNIFFVRIFADILIVISTFFLPLWISFLGVIAGLFYFKNFYEAIAIGVLADMLYGVSLQKFFHIQWVTTVLFLFLYFAINQLKQYTRFYEPSS